MWLNVVILSFACLAVGFILGWIVACPRRWDAYINRTAPAPRAAAARPAARAAVPVPAEDEDVPSLSRVSSGT